MIYHLRAFKFILRCSTLESPAAVSPKAVSGEVVEDRMQIIISVTVDVTGPFPLTFERRYSARSRMIGNMHEHGELG